MPSYKSRYTGEQVDSLLGEVPKLSRKIAESLNDGGYVNEFLKNNQQDWNQNDETKIDYIKNRPFYKGNVFLNKVNFVDDYWDGSDICELPLGDSTEFKNGDILSIEINSKGAVYSADIPVNINDQGIGYVSFENMNPPGWNCYVSIERFGGEYYLVLGGCDASYYDHDSTVEVYKSTIKQLDEKFIPDSIARTSEVKQLESVAKGAARSRVYKTYKEMAEAFTTMTADDVRVGDHIYIEQLSVPDLWISKVYETQLEGYYYYDTDEMLVFILGIEGSIPVNTPWFEVSMLETQKADLSGFVTEEEMDKTVGEINSALEEIIVLQEEILVPDGSEVEY